MKNKYFILVLFAFISTGLMAQTSVWKLESSVAAEGDWSVAENWTEGVPTTETKTVFNVPTSADCHVTGAADVKQLVIGDNSVAAGKLIIKDGGVLTTHNADAWSTVGYNQSGEMIIEAGGQVISASRFHVGLVNPGEGVSPVNVLEVAGMLQTANKFTVNDPSNAAITAEVYVNGDGMIKTPWVYIGAPSLLDVSDNGQVIMEGDQYDAMMEYVNAGYITAEGGDEAPVLEWVIEGTDTLNTILKSPAFVGLFEKQVDRQALKVYPNPATDVVYFDGIDNANVTIYSITGSVVMREENVSELNISELKTGIYLVKAAVQNEEYFNKLYVK